MLDFEYNFRRNTCFSDNMFDFQLIFDARFGFQLESTGQSINPSIKTTDHSNHILPIIPPLPGHTSKLSFRTTLGKWFSASPTRCQSLGPLNKASWSIFEASGRWDRSRTLQPRKSGKSVEKLVFRRKIGATSSTELPTHQPTNPPKFHRRLLPVSRAVGMASA